MRIGEQTGNVFMTEAQMAADQGISPLQSKMQNNGITSMQETRNSVDIKANQEALQNQQVFNAKRGQTSPRGNEFS